MHDCDLPPEDKFKENDLWICGECNVIWGLTYICISGPILMWMAADES